MSGVVSPSQMSEADSISKPAATSGDVDVELGGTSSEPCYALLTGFYEDPDTGEKSRITIPVTRFPATLGRSHVNSDDHFFGLGKKKALSRQQCKICYRDVQGGKVEFDATKGELVYKEPAGNCNENDGHATLITEQNELPPKGFFVVECLGKNRILVNSQKVEQGNAAVLASGSSLRISSYTLYFLLPTDSKPKEHIVSISPSPPKKRNATPDTPPSSTNVAKRSKSNQDELDTLPVQTLLDRMTEAIDSNLWERRHQLIGAAIALHAVQDAARHPKIQAEAVTGGVSRSDIMGWIEESPMYATWVQQMLTKMEQRSYQAAITKSLLKAGYTRTGTSGRYIKWYLPKNIPILPQEPKEDKAKDSKDKDDSDKAVDDDQQSDDDMEDNSAGDVASKEDVVNEEDDEDAGSKSKGDAGNEEDGADLEVDGGDGGSDAKNTEKTDDEEEENEEDYGSDRERTSAPAVSGDKENAEESS